MQVLASSVVSGPDSQQGRRSRHVRARAFRVATARVAFRSMAGDETGRSLRGKGAQAAEGWQKVVRHPEKQERDNERKEDEQRLDRLVDRLDEARKNDET